MVLLVLKGGLLTRKTKATFEVNASNMGSDKYNKNNGPVHFLERITGGDP